MKCTIPGPNVKVFGRAVHSLSKIGNELYMEPLEDGLAIRTVNSSRSAYACFTFKPSFFLQYAPTTVTASTQGEEEEAVRCKLTMKSCLTVFKSLSTLEKTVDKCKIHLDMKDSRLVFQLYCRHGIVKTHNLSFIECETLQAVFTKDLLPNMITAQSRLFMDAVVNFQNNQEEVSLSVQPHRFVIKNYVDDEPDPSKCIRSELALDPEEFEQYQVGIDTEVTFCLKELRAILAFSEPSNLPVSACFECAGKPIVFSITGDTGFQGDFVLATLAEPSSQLSQPTSQARNTTHHISNTATPRPTANPRRPNVPKASAKVSAPKPTTSRVSTSDDFDRDIPRKNSTNNIPSSSNRSVEELPVRSNVSSSSNTSVEERPVSTNGRNMINNTANVSRITNPSEERPVSTNGVSLNRNNNTDKNTLLNPEDGASPEIPPCSVKTPKRLLIEPMDEDDDETDGEDMLPSTPPSAKRFKSVFFGLSQSTTAGSQPQQTPRVLAEDTDSE